MTGQAQGDAGTARECADEAASLAAFPPWGPQRLGGYSSGPAADRRRWDGVADAARRHAGSPEDATIAMFDAWRAGERAQPDALTSFSGLSSPVKELWRSAAQAAIAEGAQEESNPGRPTSLAGGAFRVRELDTAVLRGLFGSSIDSEAPFLLQ